MVARIKQIQRIKKLSQTRRRKKRKSVPRRHLKSKVQKLRKRAIKSLKRKPMRKLTPNSNLKSFPIKPQRSKLNKKTQKLRQIWRPKKGICRWKRRI